MNVIARFQTQNHKEKSHETKCDECEYKVMGSSAMKEHRQSVHEASVVKKKCMDCSFQGSTELELNIHQHQKHKKDKSNATFMITKQ